MPDNYDARTVKCQRAYCHASIAPIDNTCAGKYMHARDVKCEHKQDSGTGRPANRIDVVIRRAEYVVF